MTTWCTSAFTDPWSVMRAFLPKVIYRKLCKTIHQLSNKLAAEVKWDSCCTQVQMDVCQSVKIISMCDHEDTTEIYGFFLTNFDIITPQTWPSIYVVIEMKDISPGRHRWSLFSAWPLLMGIDRLLFVRPNSIIICSTDSHFFLKHPATCWLIVLIEYFKVLTFERV